MGVISLQKAIQQLEQEGDRYVALINYLQKNQVDSIIEEDGVVIARSLGGEGKYEAILAADSPEQLKNVEEHLADVNHFFGIEAWMIPVLAEGRELVSEELCYTYYAPRDLELPLVTPPLPEIGPELIPLVDEHWSYQGEWTIPYIETCLQQGPSSVKYVDGQPVAWALVQDDGAMGCMFVLSEYRRQGYAQEVTYDLVQKSREQGLLPFVHIVQTNHKSISLTEGMGFQRLKEIAWVEIR